MKISMIVAVSGNHVIGMKSKLPWRLPEDLKYFRKVTMGHRLIMGKKTFESLPPGGLPGREIIVLSRNLTQVPSGALCVCSSLEGALSLCQEKEEVFIAGGAEVYRKAMDKVQRLYLTKIEKDYEGDTFFPDIDLSNWKLIYFQRHVSAEEKISFYTAVYEH